MAHLLHNAFTQWTDRTPRAENNTMDLGARLFGVVAKPLSWIYRAGVAFDQRLRPRTTLPLSDHTLLIVISSPLVGGVGKTPLTAHLATQVAATGCETHIITLGYKRRVAESTSNADTLAKLGDEALMLQQMTGLPLHAGSDPADLVARLDAPPNNRCLIFDNGVRRRWQNEYRIVVFTDRDLNRPVRYLPDGRWRIPPNQIWPAAGVAIIDSSQPDSAGHEMHRQILLDWEYNGPIGWYRTKVLGITRIGDTVVQPLNDIPDNTPAVFCGLGQPSRFFTQLESLGISPQATDVFPDHHAYTEADIKRLLSRCRKAGARWLLTTHKDAVKIDPRWIRDLPAYFLRISLELSDGTDMLSVILDVPK